MKLTPKQQAFCDYYLETGNATESAKRAGYSEKTAHAIGDENLRKPEIQAYIQERLASKESARIATQDEVLEFLTTQMRDDTNSQKDRIRCAELLGKRYQLFKETIVHDGKLNLDMDYMAEWTE